MFELTPIRLGGALAAALCFHCSHAEPPSRCDVEADCTTSGGSSGASGATNAGAPASGGAVATGGSPATGGVAPAGGTAPGGAPTGGVTNTAGANSTGGASGDGASGGAGQGGSTAQGGSSAGAGASTTGGAMTGGGSSSMGGAMSSAGMAGRAGAGGSGSVDGNGTPLARPGESKTTSRSYLNLGDMRLILNKWGSDELGCNTSMRIFVNTDRSFGWDFNRGACGGNKEKPDYPEVEFGIHPFGAGSNLATTPSFPSTNVLPIQVKDLQTASVTVDGLSINLQNQNAWNINFEFWLSQRNPVTDANPGVYAELIVFWGWQDTWACDQTGNVSAGAKSYGLCHQSDTWGSGWRYFQFRADGGSQRSFSGKVDVKALIDWLVTNKGYSRELWVTRFEVGSEIDDNTSGTVTMRNLTFEVNGTSKSAQFGQ
ncbi:MAG TPA: hypothetical protein VFZ53_08695 [Polyangiaceae bacterium]